MTGWHHQLGEHEFEQALGVGDGQEAWRAAVHGVAKSQTPLSDWTELNFYVYREILASILIHWYICIQSPLMDPCSYLRVLAHVFFVPVPRKPLTSNCMSSYFSVQRALTICHSGLLFHFVFFPALPWLHFKLSIHPLIYSFTHLSTYPLTHTSCKCRDRAENNYCVVESWMHIWQTEEYVEEQQSFCSSRSLHSSFTALLLYLAYVYSIRFFFFFL